MKNYSLEVSKPPAQSIGPNELILRSDTTTSLVLLTVIKKATGTPISGSVDPKTHSGTARIPEGKYNTLLQQCGGAAPVLVEVTCDDQNDVTDFDSVVESPS